MQLLHAFLFSTKAVKKKLLLATALIFLNPLYSQHPDSLFITNIYITGENYIHTNPDSALFFFNEGKKQSENRKFLSGHILYHTRSAALLISFNQNKKAFEHYDQAIEIAKKNKLTTELGLIYLKKGILHQFTGEYVIAAEDFLAAASLLKSNEDRKNVIGLYRNIISTLNNLQQQNQSLQNVLPALENDNTDELEIAAILSQKKTSEISLDFPDQTTVREISGNQMYVIFGGAKFYLANFYELSNYSNYRSVRKVPDGILSRIPDIPHDGTILIEVNGVSVYLVKDKMRHRVDNPQVLEFFGGWDALCTVPKDGLNQVPDAGDIVTMQNVNTTFNFKKEYEAINDTLRKALEQNKFLLNEVGKKLKEKNNKLQKRKILLWTSAVGLLALLFIGVLLSRNFRQKQIFNQESLKTLKEEEELHRKMAVEKERTRIATDMHDDLGAGLSKIRFLSETVQRNISEEVHQLHLQNISSSSVELVDKFNEIIWAMNEKNNSLEDLLYYIRSYAAKYCAENNLQYKIFIPEDIPSIIISGEMRRHIFLTVKESLHNVVKHAEAKNVNIRVQLNAAINITIHDDGLGFRVADVQHAGSGLRSMEQRIKNVNGKLIIENKTGTLINFSVQLPSG